jgi:uncharacterized protein (TIGR02145 family)
MKIKRIITLTVLAFSFSSSLFSQVGIGTITPHASAELDVTSTTKGFLPPRMTQAQRNAIAIPVAAGLQVWCTDCGTAGELQVNNGTTWTNMIGGATAVFACGTLNVTFTYNGASVTYGTVSRAYGGTVGTKCWLDRNLGATQVATSSTDHLAYGDLYQWGRGADGHQLRASGTTAALSSTDVTGNTNFILAPNTPFDWRSPQNTNLWQGASGANNPCPSGYRLPLESELDTERASWTGGNNAAGAFLSPLKLPMAGYRHNNHGSIGDEGSYGNYWSSAVSSTNSTLLLFGSSNANMSANNRAFGYSVRCIKD